MAKRIYRVTFENWTLTHGWQRNFEAENVCVTGGAEQAIKVANQRIRTHYGTMRLRAESVALIATED